MPRIRGNKGTDSVLDKFWRLVDKGDGSGCWMWRGGLVGKGTSTGRYGRFAPRADLIIRAHRFSYELHHGPIAPGLNVCHKCDVPGCVNPAHLFLGDQAVNMRDAKAKGRTKKQGALSMEEADEIRRLRRETGQTHDSLARQFGISRTIVSYICSGKRYVQRAAA